jgi:hypothetical protein
VEEHLPEGRMGLQQLHEQGSREGGQVQGFDRHTGGRVVVTTQQTA